MRLLVILFCCVATTFGSSAFAQATEEGAGFEDRQNNLISLAEILGTMHHLRQICRTWDRPELFRDRMKELVTLEDPSQSTRDKMVAGFNRTYNEAKNNFIYCDEQAESEMRRLAMMGQQYADALGAPLRAVEGYDYYPGEQTVEGVMVYRGGQPQPNGN